MSSSALTTLSIARDSLWLRALGALDERDRTHIEASYSDNRPVLLDLLSIVEQKKEECQKRGWKYTKSNGEQIIVRDVVDKIAKWVWKFKEIGDVIVNYDPAHASLPWGLIRFILQVTVNEAQIFGAMTEGLEQISRLVAHYGIFESIYLQKSTKVKEPLEGALVRLYTAILTYLLQAARYYDKSTISRIAKSVVGTPEGIVGVLLKKVHVEESYVAQLAKLADTETVLRVEELVDAQSSRSQNFLAQISLGLEEIRWRQLQLESYYAEDRRRLDSTLESLRGLVLGITTQMDQINEYHESNQKLAKHLAWLSEGQKREHVDKLLQDVPPTRPGWSTSEKNQLGFDRPGASSIVWLHGHSSADASKAMALVAEALLQKAQFSHEAASVAFLYCHHQGTERIKSDVIVRALTEQLSSSYLENRISSDASYTHRPKILPNSNIKECTDVVLTLTERRPAKIIIDKIDACRSDCRNELLGALRAIVKKSHQSVKILLSSSDPLNNALDFDEVSTVNLRHSLELADIVSPFAGFTDAGLSFHLVDDKIIQEMEYLGERMKRLMPVPDESFWSDLLRLEILISTLHHQWTAKVQEPDTVSFIFRRILQKVMPDVYNIHLRENGVAALVEIYSNKFPVWPTALIRRIELAWPTSCLSAEDILESCFGFLVLRDDGRYDLAHALLVEQLRLDVEELLRSQLVANEHGVVHEYDEHGALDRAKEGATMLLEVVG
ncbi:MAG: hypothetical protein M1820_003997 [Bogoriella megaspora]|nr:MAG: hypothetical protein M1820_003997 [Bogoriella megaspora]